MDVTLPLHMVESAVTAPARQYEAWKDPSNPEIYTFLSQKDSDALTMDGYSPCVQYLDAVSAQGRTVTVGEVVAMRRYTSTVDSVKTQGSMIGSVCKDVATHAIKAGLGSFFNKQ